MKRINKGLEPSDFSEWKALDKMSSNPNWNRVPAEQRESVHRSLMYEQGFICCYCEASITTDDSHIEHFRPKDKKKYPQLQLDYDNLHCSCQRDQASGEPRHCGHKKGSWFNDELLVSPMAEDCEEKFNFLGDGQILPHQGDAAAKETIKRLSLNISKLQALRAAAVEAVIESNLPNAEIQSLVTTRDTEGRFVGYCTTIKQVLLA